MNKTLVLLYQTTPNAKAKQYILTKSQFRGSRTIVWSNSFILDLDSFFKWWSCPEHDSVHPAWHESWCSRNRQRIQGFNSTVSST